MVKLIVGGSVIIGASPSSLLLSLRKYLLDNFIYSSKYSYILSEKKKPCLLLRYTNSCIRETRNLLTNADSRTDTILERLCDLLLFFLFFQRSCDFGPKPYLKTPSAHIFFFQKLRLLKIFKF